LNINNELENIFRNKPFLNNEITNYLYNSLGSKLDKIDKTKLNYIILNEENNLLRNPTFE